MLQYLHVKNLALIDEAEVDFTEGLNILTGETGAGKSILIGSINLALGEKAQKELFREEGEALVELIFSVDENTERRLKELEVEAEDGQVIFQRRILGSRSTAKLNGLTVPVSKLREASSILIDIHGQHEHQSLIKKQKQLELIDRFGGEELEAALEEYRGLYDRYRKLASGMGEAGMNEEERARETALLEHEIREIEAAALKPGEDVTLEEEYRRLSNGRRISEAVALALRETDGTGDGASERLGRALKALEPVREFDPELERMYEALVNVDGLLSDFNLDISRYISGMDTDEETLRSTEERLDLINGLKSRYAPGIEEILKCLEEKKQRLSELESLDERREQLEKELKETVSLMTDSAASLSSLRRSSAERLDGSIAEALLDLNFLQVSFETVFEETDFSGSGRDDVQFLISLNPGEPLKPLSAVASGGELSRIMLAIKNVMAEADDTDTLIFDEIDTGISGRTASKVGEKLRDTAEKRQIICITHLPQIAAMADSHFLIEKEAEEETTVSRIKALDWDDSVEELSRMLGGTHVTDAVKQNAIELKKLAHKKD